MTKKEEDRFHISQKNISHLIRVFLLGAPPLSIVPEWGDSHLIHDQSETWCTIAEVLEMRVTIKEWLYSSSTPRVRELGEILDSLWTHFDESFVEK